MELKANGKLKPLDSDANSLPLLKLRCTLFGLGGGGRIGGGGECPNCQAYIPPLHKVLNIVFLER